MMCGGMVRQCSGSYRRRQGTIFACTRCDGRTNNAPSPGMGVPLLDSSVPGIIALCHRTSGEAISTCLSSPRVSPRSASSSSAARLLDPWFGNSLIVWASLIGLILLYLSLGYALGGAIADRSPHLLTLLRLAGLGALGVGLVPTLARPVLQIASQGIGELECRAAGGQHGRDADPLLRAGDAARLRQPVCRAPRHPRCERQRPGGGPSLCCVDRGQHPRRVPAGAASHPEYRHTAHLRRACGQSAGRRHRRLAAHPQSREKLRWRWPRWRSSCSWVGGRSGR